MNKRLEEIREQLKLDHPLSVEKGVFLLAHIDAMQAKLRVADDFIVKLANETHTVTRYAFREDDGDSMQWTEQQLTRLATEARAVLAELRKTTT